MKTEFLRTWSVESFPQYWKAEFIYNTGDELVKIEYYEGKKNNEEYKSDTTFFEGVAYTSIGFKQFYYNSSGLVNKICDYKKYGNKYRIENIKYLVHYNTKSIQIKVNKNFPQKFEYLQRVSLKNE